MTVALPDRLAVFDNLPLQAPPNECFPVDFGEKIAHVLPKLLHGLVVSERLHPHHRDDKDADDQGRTGQHPSGPRVQVVNGMGHLFVDLRVQPVQNPIPFFDGQDRA